ncbi:hemolysin family protein [Blattabacterium sp. (Blaberus giganteus)]|uniref:hemolysin family protein n=1 Tax=Blattabacterium sp. (Blaberus giganteus) TaxID=1186051 RepID=UPI00025F701D|nr:hemolysin family protein [Blattabacterium sp. (Blaberus giganteus)]AFJ90962.1 transmembrane CBS domain transporter [Blattabacterium sp. (Blaberus giganteus)]
MIFYTSIVFITILVSAFFSGMEMAFISSSLFKIELEKEKKKGSFHSKLLSKSISNSKKFITTMLIGNTISLVIYGIYMGKLFLSVFPKEFLDNSLWIILLETVFSATIILIIGEFIPKIIFSVYSNELLSLFIIPVYIIYTIFYPITNSIIWISNVFLKILGEQENDKKKFFDKEDLIYFLSENIDRNVKGKEFIESEIEIFHKALDFSEKKARECMVPRKEIVSSDFSSIDNVRNIFTESGLSKIVIFKKNIDNIIGYIHYLELLKKPKNIESIIRSVELVYVTTPVREIMDLLIKKKRSIAIVLDEYGGTAGMITIEDLLEEFLGDIRDEHDENSLLDYKLNDHEFLFSARLEIDFINAKYNLCLPKSDKYETLGGLIVTYTGDIPKNGDQIVINNNFYIEIKKVSKNKIEEVFLKKKF